MKHGRLQEVAQDDIRGLHFQEYMERNDTVKYVYAIV